MVSVLPGTRKIVYPPAQRGEVKKPQCLDCTPCSFIEDKVLHYVCIETWNLRKVGLSIKFIREDCELHPWEGVPSTNLVFHLLR